MRRIGIGAAMGAMAACAPANDAFPPVEHERTLVSVRLEWVPSIAARVGDPVQGRITASAWAVDDPPFLDDPDASAEAEPRRRMLPIQAFTVTVGETDIVLSELHQFGPNSLRPEPTRAPAPAATFFSGQIDPAGALAGMAVGVFGEVDGVGPVSADRLVTLPVVPLFITNPRDERGYAVRVDDAAEITWSGPPDPDDDVRIRWTGPDRDDDTLDTVVPDTGSWRAPADDLAETGDDRTPRVQVSRHATGRTAIDDPVQVEVTAVARDDRAIARSGG